MRAPFGTRPYAANHTFDEWSHDVRATVQAQPLAYATRRYSVTEWDGNVRIAARLPAERSQYAEPVNGSTAMLVTGRSGVLHTPATAIEQMLVTAHPFDVQDRDRIPAGC